MKRIKLAKEIHKNISSVSQRTGSVRAIRELLQNCYDADSTWVKVSFTDSSIIIADNGVGIPFEVIKNWFVKNTTTKPEQDEELVRLGMPKYKRGNRKIKTELGRTYRGGGGNGRFESFKIGTRLKITSNPKGDDKAYILEYDLNTDSATLETLPALNKNHGTSIEISDLKEKWNDFKIISLQHTLIRLYYKLSLVPESSCEVFIYKNEVCKFSIAYKYRKEYAVKLFMFGKASLLGFSIIKAILWKK